MLVVSYDPFLAFLEAVQWLPVVQRNTYMILWCLPSPPRAQSPPPTSTHLSLASMQQLNMRCQLPDIHCWQTATTTKNSKNKRWTKSSRRFQITRNNKLMCHRITVLLLQFPHARMVRMRMRRTWNIKGGCSNWSALAAENGWQPTDGNQKIGARYKRIQVRNEQWTLPLPQLGIIYITVILGK